MGMGMGIDFQNPMGTGMIFENGYGCGYSSTHPVPALCPSLSYMFLHKVFKDPYAVNILLCVSVINCVSLLQASMVVHLHDLYYRFHSHSRGPYLYK